MKWIRTVLFLHPMFLLLLLFTRGYTFINLRMLVTEPPMPNSTPAPRYIPSTSMRTLSNAATRK